MPKKDGLAVLAELREDSCFEKTPIIVLAGVREGDIVRSCIAAGATGYVVQSVGHPRRAT